MTENTRTGTCATASDFAKPAVGADDAKDITDEVVVSPSPCEPAEATSEEAPPEPAPDTTGEPPAQPPQAPPDDAEADPASEDDDDTPPEEG